MNIFLIFQALDFSFFRVLAWRAPDLNTSPHLSRSALCSPLWLQLLFICFSFLWKEMLVALCSPGQWILLVFTKPGGFQSDYLISLVQREAAGSPWVRHSVEGPHHRPDPKVKFPSLASPSSAPRTKSWSWCCFLSAPLSLSPPVLKHWLLRSPPHSAIGSHH